MNGFSKLRGLIVAALALAAGSALSLTAASQASASTGQFSIIQDNSFLASPATALPQARALGATTVRVFVQWYSVAPDPKSTREPKGLNGSNPNAYPASKWAPYDDLVKTARQDGIRLDLELTGGVPRWAEGPNPPAVYRKDRSFGWRPDPKLYGQFVHAVSERYDGQFKPAGSTTPLPAVHFWSFWNEPNFGQDLGPQAINGSTKAVAPKMYRALLNAGWKAIHQTGHGHDTLLVGELAATGYPLHTPGHPGTLPGNTAQTRALVFLRALYCVDGQYRRLGGSTAARFGCPTTAAASRRFRSANPALFQATGFADHPYASKRPPNSNPATINPSYATFPVLKGTAAALDRVTGAYGSHKHFPIYNDEYGYITSPPQPKAGRYPSQTKAAAEINQAEYLSYENPRMASYAQFLLDDPAITPEHPKPGFSSGLYTPSGQAKATLYAYRLPLWLPKATVKAGSSTTIWGGARPAAYSQSAAADTVAIQMQRHDGDAWTTIRTVTVSKLTGYFKIQMKLPYTGRLRLAYTYSETEPFLPPDIGGTTIFGRTVSVTVTG